MATNDRRAYSGGYFHLELDGNDAGILSAMEGGNFRSEAIGEQVGGENLVTRYPGRQKFEDITVQVGGPMTGAFWRWLGDSLAGKPSRRNGAIVARDFDHKERVRRTFYDALIAEIQFPQLDAGSKSPKLISVKIAPERLEFKEERSGPTGDMRVDARSQKKSLPANFRFRLDGLDDACKRVSKVEAFSVKQNIIENPVGGVLRFARREAGRLEFPTLSVSLPEVDAGPWIKWWEEFVGQGNHVQKNERTGSIVYLDSTLNETMLQMHLFGVGITGVKFDKHDAGSDRIHNVTVDLYVESIDLGGAK